MSKIMFDTNAYRELAYSLKDKSEEEASGWISSLNNREQQAGHTKELNFWVVCELLKHLEDENDPAYTNCLHALNVALHHCNYMDSLYLSQPIESEIADYYKIEDSIIYYHKVYTGLIELCKELTTNGRSKLFLEKIPAVQNYINDFVDQIRPGFIDAKTRLLSDKDLIKLENDDWMNEEAYKMVIRSIVHGVSNITEVLPEADVDYFLNKFYYGAVRLCRIIAKEPTTDDFKNHIIDAEICLRIGKTDGRLIVSNDGSGKGDGLLKSFTKTGAYPDKAMTTVDYFKSLDFELDGPEKAVAV